MLYDRPYMRSSETPSTGRTSAVTILLVVTIGIFILQQVINVSFPGTGGRGNSFIGDWFALSAESFRELKVWTVLSYAFLHSSQNLLHIVGNMFGLFFLGRALEPLLGKRSFLIFYLCGALIGGLTYVFFHLNDLSSVIGASAAVAAILAFFCLHFPEQRITLLLFFIIPITLKPKWVFWGFLGISTYMLLFSELQGTGGVAHSAHLGGFLTGVVYYRYIYNRDSLFSGLSGQPSIELPDWLKRSKSTTHYQVNRTTRSESEFRDEVDRILDKINQHGFSSLSETEKSTLDKATQKLNR